MKHIRHLFRYLFLGLVLTSCSFQHEGIFTDDRSEEYDLYDYYIDKYGNEGIIAYISSDRKSIIAISLDESLESWGPTDQKIYKNEKASGYNLPSFGVLMHQTMFSLGIENFPAQYWCNNKNRWESHPRAGSWRLPTYHEFRVICGTDGENVDFLNEALEGVNGTPLRSKQMYWSCVEDHEAIIYFEGLETDYDPANRAIVSTPEKSSYSYKDRWLKKNQYYVRAIKYVYYAN